MTATTTPAPIGPTGLAPVTIGKTPVRKRQLEDLPEYNWRTPVIIGFAVLILFFGVFGLWATFTPLSSAVIAPGEVRVLNERQEVQHLEGGIVSEILVHDGELVKAGQVLIRLDGTRERAELAVLSDRYWMRKATEARLLAERDELDRMTFPKELLEQRSDPDVAKAIDAQAAIFAQQNERQGNRIEIMNQRIEQSRYEIEGYEERRRGVEEQLALIQEEIDAVETLREKGLERKPRLLALQRARASLVAERGNITSSVARVQERIGEMQTMLLDTKQQRQAAAEEQLSQVRAELATLDEQLSVIRERLSRLEVRSPRDGHVIKLAVHAPKAVIGSGQKLMEIVPTEDELVVDVDIRVNDIDVVHTGLQAQVRFSAFSQRKTHPVDGELIRISADTEIGMMRQPVYKGVIRIDPESRKEYLGDKQLTPGMMAVAVIGVGERTLLDYLLDPITYAVETALREP